jgi:DNA primase
MRDQLPDIERRKVSELASKTLWAEEGVSALSYLMDKRGLSENALKDFSIGYVPDWFADSNGTRHEFAGRIIMPIFNQYNELVALSSRDWRENASRKFYHESFKKSNYIYGLNIAKKFMLKRSQAIMVEGEMDVLYLYSKGFNFTVGMLGLSCQLYQISLLSRYASEIFVIFDGDNPGKMAKESLLSLGVTNDFRKIFGVEIIPVELPQGNDPDDFLKKNGSKVFIEFLKENRRKIARFLGDNV